MAGVDAVNRLARLSPAQRALIERRLRGDAASGPDAGGIPRRDRAMDPPPLSFAQQRIWFLEQLHADRAVYNRCQALHLFGQLDVAALERGLQAVVDRHESLRTSFAQVDGRPVQVVHEGVAIAVPVTRAAGGSLGERAVFVEARVLDEARRPFDLEAGPLIRAGLIRVAPIEHILLLTVHHLVSDRWSDGVLLRELSDRYRALVTGEPSSFPSMPLQYADFAVWQREALGGAALTAELDYWRRHLADAPSVLDFPTDRPRPAVQTFRGARHRLDLSVPLTAELTRLSRREGVTLFMTLLAAFCVALHRYTRADDLVVGVPIAGRTHVDTEGFIGFFVNTLALRTDLSGDPTFRELLGRVRQVALGAYAHQAVPFERLIEELQLDRDLSTAQLFQVMLNLHNTPSAPLSLPNVEVTPIDIDTRSAVVDLTWDLTEVAGELTGWLEYNTDLFDVATIERLAGHLQTLLKGIVADPEQRVSALPLLTAPERHQLLVEWNETRATFSTDGCLSDLFEAQVERTPDAVAVIDDNERLTFRELNRRANGLARRLTAVGVRLETSVGLCVERSAEMIVGVLGILKAGGAYVPLDPAYPPDRLAFMVDDAAISVLVTDGRTSSSLPAHGAQIVCLDDLESGSMDGTDANPVSEATADSVAYIVYTSGSTGTPKGVLGLHRGAINRCRWMWETYPFVADDVCSHTSSLSFVDSVWEVFGPLLCGLPLVVVPEGARQDPARLIHCLATHGVTRLVVVPSLLISLLETEPELGRRLPRLRYWSTGAEPLSRTLVERFYESVPNGRLLNLYGSSEVTADATCYEVTRKAAQLPRVPIGRPIANARVYILDRHLQPVPVGVAGELHVGGAGLARGYLDRPALTAERFIPDPFAAESGARHHLYKMGDLARFRPNGEIEYLGRLDDQVQIRGYRVEVGEVEAGLRRHQAVREAVVVAREDTPGDVRLVAYVVPRQEPAPTVGELRAFLKRTLPDYMVPSGFVPMAELPLMPNGKLDRKALPLPSTTRPELDAAFVPPRTPTEAAVAKVWSDLLGVSRVGVDDDFFDLGGHSLLAVQVMARIRDACAVELPLRRLFEAPTVALLAGCIEAEQGGEAAVHAAPPPRGSLVRLIPEQPVETEWPIFAVPGGAGDELHLMRLARLAPHLDARHPIYGFLASDAGGSRTNVDAEAEATDYVKQVRAYQPEGPYLLIGLCIGGRVAYEMAQQLLAQGETIAGLFLLDTWRPGALDAINQASAMGLARDARGRIAELRRYRARPYPGRITLFLNEDWHDLDPSLGWHDLALGGLETHVIPGDHRMFQQERIVGVGERLRQCLNEAVAAEGR